jgi:sn-glycerol 3-phosphate transport system substrate-binding protein
LKKIHGGEFLTIPPERRVEGAALFPVADACAERGGEAGAQSGVLDDDPGELRMALEKPGPAGDGGVLVGGAALYLVKKGSSPAQQAASFEFTKWLNSPEIQADWSASTGYVPTRMSATKQPILANKWAQSTNYKVAYDQLVNGPNNAATSGPVIGAYQAVRDAILIAQQKMFTQNLAPAKALAEAKRGADAAILEYNQRVGG